MIIAMIRKMVVMVMVMVMLMLIMTKMMIMMIDRSQLNTMGSQLGRVH